MALAPFSFLWKLDDIVLMLLLGGLATLVFAQVVARYVFGDAFFWSEEVARVMFSWLSFLGIASVTKRVGHVGVELFVGRLSPLYQKVIATIVELILLVFYAGLTYWGFRYAFQFSNYETAALQINYRYIYLAMPISGLLLMLYVFRRLRLIWRGEFLVTPEGREGSTL